MEEKISEALSLAMKEKEAFQRMLRQTAAEAAELGECFNGTGRALEVNVEAERSLSSELEEVVQKMRRSIEASARELQRNQKKVGVAKFLLEGVSRDLGVRKEELREVEELIAARRTELAVKNEELEYVGGLISAKYAEIADEVRTKETELETVKASLVECSEAVESKRKELEQIQDKIKESRRVPEIKEEQPNPPESRELHLQAAENQNERLPEEAGLPHCELIVAWSGACFSVVYLFCFACCLVKPIY